MNDPKDAFKLTGHGPEWKPAHLAPSEARAATAWVEARVDRSSLTGKDRVEDVRDRRVIHHREGLAFGLEARDHLLGVHAGLDDLEGYLPVHRASLLSEPHVSHPAFAHPQDQPVRTDGLGSRDRAGRSLRFSGA